MVSIRLPFVLSFFSAIFFTNGFPVAGGPGWPQRYATPQQSGTAQQPPEGQQSGEVQEILPPIGQLPISVAEQQPLPEVNQSAIQPQLIGQYPPGPGVQTNIEGPQPPINGVAQQPPIAQQPITELQPIPALIEPIVPQIPVVGEQTNAGVQQPPIPGLAQNLEGLQAIQAPLEPIVSQIPVVEEQTNVEVQQPPIPGVAQNGAAHQLIITQQPAEELQAIPAPLEPIVPQIPVVGEQTNDGVQQPPISLQPIVPQIPAVGEQTNTGVQQPPIPVIAQNGAAHQLTIAQHPAEGLSPIPAPEEILEVISQQPPVIAEQPNIVAQKPPMPGVVQHEVVHQQPIAQQPPIPSSSEELYQLIAQLASPASPASPVTKEQENVEAQKSISGVVQHEVAHQIPISQQPQMPVAIPLSLEEILKLIAQQPPVIGEQPNPNVGAQKPLIPGVVQHGVTPIPVAELQPISPTREAQQSLQIAQLPPAADEQPEAQQQGMVQPERPLEQQPSSPEAQFPPMVIALEPATLGMQEPQPKEYIAIMQTYKFIFKF